MVEDEGEGEIQDVCRSSNDVVEVHDASNGRYVSYKAACKKISGVLYLLHHRCGNPSTSKHPTSLRISGNIAILARLIFQSCLLCRFYKLMS